MTDATLLDLEQGVIGGVLLDPSLFVELPALEAWHFHHLKSAATWEAMRRLAGDGKPLDTLTVELELERMGRLDAVGRDFLGLCALRVPIAQNTVEYATRIRDAALHKRVRERLSSVLERATKHQLTGAELLTDAFGALAGLDAEEPDECATIGQLVQRRCAQLEKLVAEREAGGAALTGFPTGSEALDKLLGGWQPGIVSLIAARPAMGKSSLGLAAADACTQSGVGVHLFSLEDSWHAYADRALARTSRVPASVIRGSEFNRAQMSDVAEALRNLIARKGWLIDSRGGITADEIVRTARRHARENGTRVVIVDYVQLVKRPRHHTVHEELTAVVDAFANAAKQDGMAYVVMSQLNRGVEQRADKRPLLGDLRESGSLEERAKCVVAIYRGSYYGPDPQPDIDYDTPGPAPSNFEAQVQLLVLKNSNGATGRVFATWHGPTLRLE